MKYSDALRVRYRKGGRQIELSISDNMDTDDFSVEIHEEKREEMEIRMLFKVKEDIELIRLDYFSMPIGEPDYMFIGGLKYMEKGEERSAVPYGKTGFPYDRYYSQRILHRKERDGIFVSSIYTKMPLVLAEKSGKYLYVHHEPIIFSKNGVRLISFIKLSDELRLSIFGEYDYLFKDTPWLGRGKKRKKRTALKKGDVVEIRVRIREGNGNWISGIKDYLGNLPDIKVDGSPLSRIKKAFRRCYNAGFGCFMQLPYKNSTGFLFSDYSYNLMAFEAMRLNIFHKAWKLTGDDEYKEWVGALRNLLKDPKFSIKTELGRVWYNSSVSDGKELRPFTYLGDTYGAYPGGQAEIAYNLMEYRMDSGDKGFDALIKETLEYIMNTQNSDGSWPMARKDTIKCPRPKTTKRKSVGNTAACVKALALAYMIYNDERYLKHAKRGAEWLDMKYPKGFNAVLDAGIDEVEALSAIYVIDAFIEMWKDTKDERYAESAERWAYHSLTWLYLWDTKELDIKYMMGPFSATITPRASPYETVMLSNALHRLHEISGDGFWKRMSDILLRRAMDFTERDGGLSEAYSINENGLVGIPVEQCFASTELLRAYLRLPIKHDKREKKEVHRYERPEIKGREVLVNGKEMIELRENGMIRLFDKIDMGFSFYDVYSERQRKSLKRHRLARKLGKISLIREIPAIFRGYGDRKREKGMIPWEKVEKRWDMGLDGNGVYTVFGAEFHRIELNILIGNDEIAIRMNIRVLSDDLYMSHHILAPYFKKTGKVLGKNGIIGFQLGNETIRVSSMDGMEVSDIDGVIGFDTTLESNWSHQGVFSTEIRVERENH